MGMFGKQSGMNYIGNRLTAEQLNTISYAYMDVCAMDKVINDDSWDHRAIAEIGEAVVQTKRDLEKEFPFLIEDVEDE